MFSQMVRRKREGFRSGGGGGNQRSRLIPSKGSGWKEGAEHASRLNENLQTSALVVEQKTDKKRWEMMKKSGSVIVMLCLRPAATNMVR